MSSAQSRPPARCGSGRRILRGRLDATLVEQRERRHPGGDRRLERLAEERPERDVLPGLDVARAPVVDEDDAEHVLGETLRRHRLAACARHADDEAELELEVEAARRRVHRRVSRPALERCPRGRRDIGAADDDRARASVVADRKPAPVRRQRLGVGPEEPAHVRRVLERRARSRRSRRPRTAGAASRRRAHARAVVRARGRERLGPRVGAERHQRIERRLRVDVAERREVDDLVAVAPTEIRGGPPATEKTPSHTMNE